MNRITDFQLPPKEQPSCQLFTVLPGEVRDRIFTYALSCYENPDKVFDKDTSYIRPGYNAPSIADTRLLQTCQRVYNESWWRTWVSAVHTFFLAWSGRRPWDGEYMTVQKLQPSLNELYDTHGEIEIDHIRVYAQLCYLEDGDDLNQILDMQNFFPRRITITLRHHDWYNWESDQQLRLKPMWVNKCLFPNSVREICMELESLQRKKDQIEWIANEMVEKWHFQKKDGTIMSVKLQECSVDTWSGSSTWENQRWIRDETKPETNEYYVKTMVWKPNADMTERPQATHLNVPGTFQQMHMSRPYIPTDELDKAGIPPGLTADETKKRVEQWEIDNPPFEDEDDVPRIQGFGVFDDDYYSDNDIGQPEDEEQFNNHYGVSEDEREEADSDWEL